MIRCDMDLCDLRRLGIHSEQLRHLIFELSPNDIEASTGKPGNEQLQNVSLIEDRRKSR